MTWQERDGHSIDFERKAMKVFIVFAAFAALVAAGSGAAQEHAHPGMMQPPSGMMQAHAMRAAGSPVDVPVMLKQAKVAFRIDRVAPSGNNSFVLQQIEMLSDKLGQMGAEAKIVAVFLADGGFMLLNDTAYDSVRRTSGGNPYKAAIAGLMARGIEVEECGMTMMREGWNAKQLLPGVKVNAGANLRIIDLSQKNYVVLNQ
jgi:intracellular sulfur oxidation DsrE/DsrF family protein